MSNSSFKYIQYSYFRHLADENYFAVMGDIGTLFARNFMICFDLLKRIYACFMHNLLHLLLLISLLYYNRRPYVFRSTSLRRLNNVLMSIDPRPYVE